MSEWYFDYRPNITRRGHEGCTLTMVKNLIESYAVVTGVVGGVQFHGIIGATSSRLLTRHFPIEGDVAPGRLSTHR